MKTKTIISVTVFSILAFAVHGCDIKNRSAGKDLPEVTIPNGSSPAKANAPRAPMNDTDAMRAGWNHGNGALWVFLPPAGTATSDDMENDGSLRIKFGWWRGIPGQVTVEGRRLDAPAAPLRYSTPPLESYGKIGFIPSYLFFPTEGYWEITGHLGDQSLTFVIYVVKI